MDVQNCDLNFKAIIQRNSENIIDNLSEPLLQKLTNLLYSKEYFSNMEKESILYHPSKTPTECKDQFIRILHTKQAEAVLCVVQYLENEEGTKHVAKFFKEPKILKTSDEASVELSTRKKECEEVCMCRLEFAVVCKQECNGPKMHCRLLCKDINNSLVNKNKIAADFRGRVTDWMKTTKHLDMSKINVLHFSNKGRDLQDHFEVCLEDCLGEGQFVDFLLPRNADGADEIDVVLGMGRICRIVVQYTPWVVETSHSQSSAAAGPSVPVVSHDSVPGGEASSFSVTRSAPMVVDETDSEAVIRKDVVNYLKSSVGREWKELARQLPLNSNQMICDGMIEDIEHEKNRLSEKVYQMLTKWVQESQNPTEEKLVAALRRSRLNRIADKVQRMLLNTGKAVTDHPHSSMSTEDAASLQRWHEVLVDQMHPESVLDHLHADDILDRELYSSIKGTGLKIRYDINRSLLQALPNRGSRAYQCFVSALRKTLQGHLVEKLKS